MPEPMSRSPLRIVHVITPSRLSGAELHLLDLAQELDARGHTNVVLCKHRARAVIQEGVCRGVDIRPTPIYGKFDFTAIFRLARIIRAERADVVHTHLSTATEWGSLAARLAGRRCIATVQGRNVGAWYWLPHHVIANSRAVKAHLVRHGVRADKIAVIYNAIRVASFRRNHSLAEAKERLGIPPSAVVVGTAAHLSRKKGHADLLRGFAAAFRTRREVRLLFLGDGRLRVHLERLAGRLGIADRVAFLGFRRDVRDVMSAYDVFVLASWWEPFGLVLLEAMALGVPCIATNAGGAPEVVAENETALLVPPRDPEALARAMTRLVDDESLRERLGAAGPTRAALFDIADKAAEVEREYLTALEQARDAVQAGSPRSGEAPDHEA